MEALKFSHYPVSNSGSAYELIQYFWAQISEVVERDDNYNWLQIDTINNFWCLAITTDMRRVLLMQVRDQTSVGI